MSVSDLRNGPEEFQHFFRDVIIVSQRAHILGRSPGVHGHILKSKLADKLPHGLSPTAHIIDYERADQIESSGHNPRTEAVYGQAQSRSLG